MQTQEQDGAGNEIDLQALGLFDDGEQPVDLDNLPEERSSLPKEVPQPGVLVLRIPLGLEATPQIFSAVVDSGGEKRLQVKFREEYALQIQPSGAALHYNVTDYRNKDRDGNVSGEMLSLVKALGYKGPINGKADFVKAIIEGRGKDFKADLSYTATCASNRAAWRNGKKSDRPGCGQKYEMRAQEYQKKDGTNVVKLQIPREGNGIWKNRFQCVVPGCGADVMCFVRLSKYRGK